MCRGELRESRPTAPNAYVLEGLDEDAFVTDMMAAKDAVGEATEADARHLQGLVRTTQVLLYGGHVLLFLGTAQVWGCTVAAACLLAAAMIGVARCMKWTIIAHHVCHGGFDQLQRRRPGHLEAQYKRGVFAVGYRRFLDWMDWMLPEAWDAEHNKMHHYYLSEEKDPDVVEQNFELLRGLPIPSALKYASMLLWLVTWKYSYYSSNTFKELQLARKGSWVARHWPAGTKRTAPVTVFTFIQEVALALSRGAWAEAAFWPVFFALWLGIIVPMALMVCLPAVTPLALGADLYRYETSCKAYSAEWFCRCAHSSVNFECGNDFVDCLYGWLNYQIEHHMFPDMTPLQYRKLQPLVESICRRHGVLYVQQNALLRTWEMFRVAVGDASMRRCTALIPPKASRASPGRATMEVKASKDSVTMQVPDAILGS